jgi:nitrate/nitrite transport system ATP-binding protein
MVTHDVDEALFVSDRIVMMTSGPRAKVGDILTVPFARPRDRAAVMAHPDYYVLRERLIGFLEDQAHPDPSADVMQASADEESPISSVTAAAPSLPS